MKEKARVYVQLLLRKKRIKLRFFSHSVKANDNKRITFSCLERIEIFIVLDSITVTQVQAKWLVARFEIFDFL